MSVKLKMETGKKQKFGELLIQYGLINNNQLRDALKVQAQAGGSIGSILLELGYITLEKLLEFLSKHFNVPSVNLYDFTLEPSVIKILPFDKMKSYKVLPLAIKEKFVTLAMVNPNNHVAIRDLEFILGRPMQPVVVPCFQMNTALKRLDERGGKLDKPLPITEPDKTKRPEVSEVGIDLRSLFISLVEEKGSDLILSAGVPPCIKKNTELKRLAGPQLKPQQLNTFALQLLSANQREEFKKAKEIDFAYSFPDIGRFRINIYRQRNSTSIAARYIVEIIPSLEELRLPLWVEDFALKTQGLILITGPAGHGKTTTVAAMVDIINAKRKCNIITIEDPIEYLHKHKLSNVNQREVGIDTDSFHEGLKHIFRQAPDVIVIGEMRDLESFSIALQAADTGHLILSTLHSNNATSAIDRIIDVFPPAQQQQVKVQLAENFLLILNQRLVPLKDGTGRILAYEKLVNSYRVKNMIREGKTHHIRSILQQSVDDFLSIDQNLASLCIEGKISQETGLKYCDSHTYFTELVSKGRVQ
ncbi:MAG TPA: PilT/PilU family type 4a pilus ATPase [Thermodesulfovibrionales bacterium]|nr:PilT/PilU family type 4a pilus ATPase [Thermodesulfovibrionales bacterium]